MSKTMMLKVNKAPTPLDTRTLILNFNLRKSNEFVMLDSRLRKGQPLDGHLLKGAFASSARTLNLKTLTRKTKTKMKSVSLTLMKNSGL